MKYLITHLNEPNPDRGTVWESLNDHQNRHEIVCGSMEIDGSVVKIYNYNLGIIPCPESGERPMVKSIIFAADIKNVTVSALPDESGSSLQSNIEKQPNK